MTRIAGTVLRLLAFMVLQAIVFTVLGALIIGPVAGGIPSTGQVIDPAGQLLALAAYTLSQGAALALVMAGLKAGRGARFGLAFLIAFVTGTVLTQIDSFVYFAWFRSLVGWLIVLMSTISALTAAALATLLFRKGVWRQGVWRKGGQRDAPLLPAGATGWAFSLGAIALLHVIVYYVVGYVVVWVNDEARAFYDGGTLSPFFAHMGEVLRETGWIIPVQIVRGLLWAGVAAVIFRFSRGGRARLTGTVLAVYLAFHVAPLLLPQDMMPQIVRLLHLVELAITAVVMALLAAALLRPWSREAR